MKIIRQESKETYSAGDIIVDRLDGKVFIIVQNAEGKYNLVSLSGDKGKTYYRTWRNVIGDLSTSFKKADALLDLKY